MANNFVMRRAGSSDPWSKNIPSDGGTLSGSTSFEVKPTANNEATFDLTGRLEVTLINSSKKLVCSLRQKGHRQEDEDPGKQYHFYFRGKSDTDQNIFVGIECDGRLLSEINATNQDIADYQIKTPSGLISRESTFYVDIFSYYIQGTKDSSGRYVFDDLPENRVQVGITISNLPDWLHLDRKVEVTGITDGGVANCTCWRATFSCDLLTNYQEDEEDPTDPEYQARFPLNTVVSTQYRGIPRTQTIRIQPDFGNQKELNFKQYGGYRSNFIFGKQLELNATELNQAAYGYYEIVTDNSGSMANYNKATLQRLPEVDLGMYGWVAENPTIDFVFKLGSHPTNTYYEWGGGTRTYMYIGYPWIVSGLHIINTLDYGINKYDNMRIKAFHDLVSGNINIWNYIQSNALKTKLAIKGNSPTYFHIDVISLNDLYRFGYVDLPTVETGDSHTLRSPRDTELSIPYINIPNIINGKRSLTAKECQGYLEWINQLNQAWKQKLHSNTLDIRLGDSSNIYLLIPRINISGYGDTQLGIGSDGNVRLNEWFGVENAEQASQTNADPAITNLTWGMCNFVDDPTSIFTLYYDELVQFRFKIID